MAGHRHEFPIIKHCKTQQPNYLFAISQVALLPRLGREDTDSVAVTAKMADLMLHHYFSWKRRCRDGGRNRHVEEVF
jgi:hypothetical protein